MQATERHREAEERFHELLIEAELPAPDEVSYEPESVVFYWHEPKLAVFVDFEDDDDEPSADPGRTSTAAG
jgi:hypothetical protein